MNTPYSGHCFEEGDLVLICDPFTSVHINHSSKAYDVVSDSVHKAGPLC